MATRGTQGARAAAWIAAFVLACGNLSADVMKITASDPQNPGDIRVKIKTTAREFNQLMPIDPNVHQTAADKAEFIRSRINLANVIGEWGWTVTRAGATVTVQTPMGEAIREKKFDIGTTGEARDELTGRLPGGDEWLQGVIRFDAESFGEFDASGNPAIFRVGVVAGASIAEHVISIDDLDEGGTSGANIASKIFENLGASLGDWGLAMSIAHVDGTDFIEFNFFETHNPGDDIGIVFGTTSIGMVGGAGMSGLLHIVPEPASGLLLLLGALGGLLRRMPRPAARRV